MPELTPEKIALFDRLLAGTLLPGDAEALTEWLGTDQPDEATMALVMQQLRNHENSGQAVPDEVITRLEQRLPLIFATEPKRKGVLRSIVQNKWMRYAAMIVVLLNIGIFIKNRIELRNSTKTEQVAELIPLEQIQPGKDGAILTLVDGSTMVLDSMGNGLVTTQKRYQSNAPQRPTRLRRCQRRSYCCRLQ
ncbi:MAG: hypothetical protein NVV59_20335 [Chitinophagaceae bacterium]|nr:hypothetical protein [Chitinophagaceae bacterium]